jgi:hypothetical protein
MKRLRNIIRKLGLFDILLIAFFICGVGLFAFIFFRKTSHISVTIKVNTDSVIYYPGVKDVGNSPWFANLFYRGMSEKDSLGRKQAEVTDVVAYDARPSVRDVYLKLNIVSVYQRSTGQYSYNGKPILIGGTMKLKLNGLDVSGLVTNVDGLNDPRKQVKIFVQAQVKDDNGVYLESSGIDPVVAEAIPVGYEVKDSTGKVVIKITDKKVSDAKRLVVTSDGRTLIGVNPLRKNVILNLEVYATEMNGKYYLFDDVPILVGEYIPLNTDKITVYPIVMNFSLNEK